MTTSTWRTTGNSFYYQKEQYSIFYQEIGQGETILLLHGFPTASWDWSKVWLPLAKHYHLLAPDFIGFGFSDKPKRYTYSIIDQANVVEALIRQKGMTRLHLLAHDYGDTVAQELLARVLEGTWNIQLQSMTLLNGGLFPETHQPRFLQKALISPIGILLTPFLTKSQLRRNFHAIFGAETPPSEAEIDEFFSLIDYNNGKYVMHLLIRYMRERVQQRERWVGALQQTSVPLLHINGNADPISGRHLANRYRELIPNAQVIDLPAIGHYPQVEAPELWLDVFLEHLRL
jgi:pimeloyl-ACP methyl ester carboxylesterase